jgi:hypothetical protein
MKALYDKLTGWAGSTWWKCLLVALPVFAIFVALFLLGRRPQPVGNPDLEAAEAEQKAETQRRLAEVLAEQEAARRQAAADQKKAAAQKELMKRRQEIEAVRTEEGMRALLEKELKADE